MFKFLKMKSGATAVLAAAIFMMLANPVIAGVPIVSSIIDDVEGVAKSIIDHGFNRLDKSMINFGIELERSASVFRETYAGILQDTVDAIDGPQKNIVQDMQNLLTAVENAEIDQLDEVIDAQRQTVDKIYALFSDVALVTKVTQSVAVEGDRTASIELTGASLNVDDIIGISFSGMSVDKSKVVNASNSGLTFKLPLGNLNQEDRDRGVWFLPFEAKFETCGFWGFLVGCDKGVFRHELIVFPKNLGYATAVFSGKIDVLKRRSVSRGPYRAQRVRTRVRGFRVRRGQRTDVHTANAASGWSIDVKSSKFKFTRDFGGCSSNRSIGTWIRRDTKTLQVRAVTASDGRIGATCRTTTTIYYDEVRTEKAVQSEEIGGEAFPLVIEGQLALKLPENTKLQQPRLAHVVVKSDLIRADQNYSMIITPNGKEEFGQGAVKVKSLPASNSVYISIQ